MDVRTVFHMKSRKIQVVLALLLVGGVGAACFAKAMADQPPEQRRAAARQAFDNGNFNDAFGAYRDLAVDSKDDPARVSEDFNLAVQSLQRLGRHDELDEFRETVIAAHAGNWRLQWTAAISLQGDSDHGFIVAGKFYRGGRRGNDGRYANSIERDRVRMLQLMRAAEKLTGDEPRKNEVADFYLSFGSMLQDNRYGNGAWRLQSLTDLSKLPDYEEGYRHYYGQETRGAPVDEKGNPVFHKLPKSWDESTSDGERWRWCLARAEQVSPPHKARARYEFAQFLRQQFDVHTMAQNRYFGRGYFGGIEDSEVGPEGDKDEKNEKDPAESGPYAVSTLGEDETIAKLATGVRRFKLPDEFNFIRIFRQVADEANDKDGNARGWAEQALNALAQVFTDRQQYPKAADCWRRSIARFGNGGWKQNQLHQIVGNWGRFDPVQTAPAGTEPAVSFLFRNATKVRFTANEIDVRQLLGDVKEYLKSRGNGQLEWEKIDVGNIGHRLVERNQVKYVGKQVAEWDLELSPRKDHFDKRITVRPPVQKAGAYLVTSQMEGGNASRVIVWLADTVVVKKPVDQGAWVYVADARSGAPVAKADVEFFGFRQEHLGDNKWKTTTHEFSHATDDTGQVLLGAHAQGPADVRAERRPRSDHNYLITATTPDGRLAFYGFSHVWSGGYHDYEYNQHKTFGITDRPVYRPGQPVKFKFWLNEAKYDRDKANSPYAGQSFAVQLLNPKSEKVYEAQFTADEFGGFDGELPLPSDATLGVYNLQVLHRGGVTFRVEEYKKPEFEVKVEAPAEPAKLGDKVTATINARYYFGAPVAEAKVKYKVVRSEADANWYPSGKWDWFYGPGYWWFCGDYPWYPGWREWGCRAPLPWWYHFPRTQPEVVSENEVVVGADGRVQVEIDTGPAKALHGDLDHRYEIVAEVTDNSRRTIVGTGAVTVARKPFKVYAWVDRGYYAAGDVVNAEFYAQTLDRKPIASAKGKLRLMKVAYDAKLNPAEKEVGAWDVGTNPEGRASQQIKAGQSGQYRLVYDVTDAKGNTIQGGYVFVVRGAGKFDDRGFRFNDLELVADKREYQPGDRVRLMVNANRENSTVLLFLRPANGMYLPPKVVRLNGKSALEEIEIVKKDMPNFFVEALTVSGGKVFTQAREVVVPPENRVVNVQVLPNKTGYKPGEKAKVAIKLTDGNGEPIVGAAVVSLYDKSVEYVSGGSNVPEIKAFFWKWRRQHRQVMENSLRHEAPIQRSNEVAMAYLGQFGHMVADLPMEEQMEFAQNGPGGARGRGGAVAPSAAAPVYKAMRSERFAASADEARSNVLADKEERDSDASGSVGGDGSTPLAEATVRKNFADTALWVGNLITNRNGVAEVELTMPENLTTWKTRVWSMAAGTRVGQGEADVVTTKDLIVRLQSPRFFTQKDQVVLSANVHNYLASPKRVKVTLQLEGSCLAPTAPVGNKSRNYNPMERWVEIAPKGEARVDWLVDAISPGTATVRMVAQTDVESDAMQMSFPVYIHGMLKTDSYSGALRPGDKGGSLLFRVPNERLVEHSRLEIRYSPSVAAAMVDALPYLVDYPYGCTEQTLNRFIPTVITQRTLVAMGVDLKTIRDKRTNLNAQEIGDDKQRANDWKRNNPPNPNVTERNPVFDEAVVNAMVKEGVTKLTNMQLSDGGWGWFSGFGEHSSPHTTAVVVHGLQLARANDVAVPAGVIERGVEWLKRYQAEQVRLLNNAKIKKDPWKTAADNLDAFVLMVLTETGVRDGETNEMSDFLYRDRTHLAVYAKAVLGLALHQRDEKAKLGMVMQNISQYLVRDDENQTAYLRLPEGNYWWYWYGSDTEANAFYLKLLALTDPKGADAARLAKYLINNRRHATYWNSTRDTAYCVEALAEFAKRSGETAPDMTVAIAIDGRKVKEVRITKENLFTFDNKLVLTGANVPAGEHRVEFLKTGTGPLYYNAYVTNFTLEDHIKKAGLEVKVQRKFYRLVPIKDATAKAAGSRGQAVDQKVEKYRRQELNDGDTLTSGELVEVELEIDSKNDYEYLLFEDMKGAGFEPVEVRSGYNGNDLNAYMELRDERVCFFARTLARGKHSVAYRLRAEVPGKFSALPTRASAMYAPELKANSDENKLNIQDAPPHPKAPATAATSSAR